MNRFNKISNYDKMSGNVCLIAMHFAFIGSMNANTYGHENLDPLGKQASTMSLVRDIGKRYE